MKSVKAPIVNFHRLTPEVGSECDQLLQDLDLGLIYGSYAYLQFLEQALPGTSLGYLLAREHGQLVGFMPLACLRGNDGRAVVNSLPFFGSHGGPWVVGSASQALVQRALVGAAVEHARSISASAITLVENPLAPLDCDALTGLNLTAVDERIGQLSWLPPRDANIEGALFGAMHVKTRNAVRKGMSQGLEVQRRTDASALTWLQTTHESSIRALGGIPKSMHVMHALLSNFPLGSQAELYVGLLDGEIAVALLLLLHRDTVEYFTPAVSPQHRDRQLLSALILYAMRERVEHGSRLWNWGGTWLGQHGVHRFKRGWGARDLRYRYFNLIWDESLHLSPDSNLASNFPFFYVRRYVE
jgi:hypothetical protein